MVPALANGAAVRQGAYTLNQEIVDHSGKGNEIAWSGTPTYTELNCTQDGTGFGAQVSDANHLIDSAGDLEAALSDTDNFYSAYVYETNAATNGVIFFRESNGGITSWIQVIQGAGNLIKFQIGAASFSSVTGLDINTCYFVAMEYSAAGNEKIWISKATDISSEPDAEANIAGALGSTDVFVIGRFMPNAGFDFQGTISDVQVFSGGAPSVVPYPFGGVSSNLSPYLDPAVDRFPHLYPMGLLK